MINKKYLKLTAAALIVLSLFSLHFTPLANYLSLEFIQTSKSQIHLYTDSHPILSPILFTLVYMCATALSLPGAALLTLLAGFVFGIGIGFCVVNIGATLGACGAFLATRYLVGQHLQKKVGGRIKQFNAHFAKRGTLYLLSIRLMAVIPFFVINVLAGLTTISLFTFTWTTSVGIIPGSLAFLNAGKQLGTISSVSDVFTPKILGSFLIIGMLPLLPMVYKKLNKQ